MIGLGTMGRNFLLNIAEQGIAGVGYDLDTAKRGSLLAEGAGMPVVTAESVPDLLAKLAPPRNIMLLVPAGPIVDSVIAELTPHLGPDDLIIDGGNSHFTDTERREAELATRGFGFTGMGVSGGSAGARHGASIMPGGRLDHFERVRPALEAVAAKVNGEPCVAYMGTGSAGHFVKMVHNGIEYGMMQLIAETYDAMRRILGLSVAECADIFRQWNAAELNSFLIEITAAVLSKIDAETGVPLVDQILDTAGQKGTGKWTSQAAMDLGIPVPTIDSAVSMRQISALRDIRFELAGRFPAGPEGAPRGLTVDLLRDALLCGFVITYAQGMHLLQAASAEKNYGSDLQVIAKIWRGGCIIRSAMLEKMRNAYASQPGLPNLLLDPDLGEIVAARQNALRRVVVECNAAEIPVMCYAASLNYFDAFRTKRLPANLIQGQRDFFGAHTYMRLDREGIFHTEDWQ